MDPTELWSIISRSVAQVSRRWRGSGEFKEGRRYDVWHVLQVHLFLVYQGWSSNVLYEKLNRQDGFRRRYGLPNRLISHAQFKQRRKSTVFRRALLELLSHSAREVLRRLGAKSVRVVLMDLTSLKSDPNRDSKAAWGFDSRGFFYGYKLGLITSEEGAILGMTLMRGNWTEHRVAGSLIRQATEVIRGAFGELSVDYLVCDSGFDADKMFRTVHRLLKARAICPPKRTRDPFSEHAAISHWRARTKTPDRFRDELLLETLPGKLAFRKRTGIERVNGQIKDTSIRIADLPRGHCGVRRLFPICLAKLVIYNFKLMQNAVLGRPLRQIRAWGA